MRCSCPLHTVAGGDGDAVDGGITGGVLLLSRRGRASPYTHTPTCAAFPVRQLLLQFPPVKQPNRHETHNCTENYARESNTILAKGL